MATCVYIFLAIYGLGVFTVYAMPPQNQVDTISEPPLPDVDPLSGNQELKPRSGGVVTEPCRGLDCGEFERMSRIVRKVHMLMAARSGQTISEATAPTMFGDIVVTEAQAQNMLDHLMREEEQRASGSIRATPTGGGRRQQTAAATLGRWTSPVPYVIDKTAFVGAALTEVNAGVDFWRQKTCLDFQEYTLATVPQNEKYIYIQAGGSGCWSYVGQLPGTGAQLVNIGRGCETVAVVTHELGHALGMYHEQARADRDSYVTVVWNKIQTGFAGNFYIELFSSTLGVPYDYGSVMHYGLSFFSVDGSPTLIPKDSGFRSAMGQRTAGTFFDIKGMNLHYSCPACPFLICQNGGIPNSRTCASCICPEGFGGTLCQTSGVMSPGCTPSTGEITVTSTDESCLTSPQYPLNYLLNNDEQCNWILKASSTAGRIQYYFKGQFNLRANGEGKCFHWVEFKDGTDLTLRGKRSCGSSLPSGSLVSKTDKLVVSFDGRYGSGYTARFQLCYKLWQSGAVACASNPCERGGTCSEKAGDFVCSCPFGYVGPTCNIDEWWNPFVFIWRLFMTFVDFIFPSNSDVSVCAHVNPCQHFGTCVDQPTGYSCTCPRGFEGTNCEVAAETTDVRR